MRQVFYTIVLFLSCLSGSGQSLSLDSCQALARKNHPLLRQLGLIDQLSQSRQENIRVSNLPQFDFTARASWQSDVTKINFSIPGFTGPEPLSKDQYKAYVDIKQKLFDGGVAKKRQELEEADRQVSQMQTETELYKIKETVNTLFFNMLVIQENKRIVALKKETLDARIKIVRSAVQNGATLPNELDQLMAERLLADQQETEIISTQQINLTMLEILTGVQIPAETGFIMPTMARFSSGNDFSRPELFLFKLQQQKLNKSSELSKVSRKPYAYAFGEAGYGRPGLNMLNNNFADWYLVGAGLSWNIFDWHKSSRERAEMKLQNELINTNKDNLTRSLKLSFDQEENNYQKLKQLISSDEQIVTLKEQISKRSAAALENGALTSADYIRDLNGALQSRANLETHKIQLIQSSINMQTIQGNK